MIIQVGINKRVKQTSRLTAGSNQRSAPLSPSHTSLQSSAELPQGIKCTCSNKRKCHKQPWLSNPSVLMVSASSLSLSVCPRMRRGEKKRWRGWQRRGRRGGGGGGGGGERTGGGWEEQWWRFHGNEAAAAGSPRHGEDGGVRTQGSEHTCASTNTSLC